MIKRNFFHKLSVNQRTNSVESILLVESMIKSQFFRCFGVFVCYFSSNAFAVPTSVTDDDQYPKFCQKAAENDACFAQFKNIPVYSGVVENVSYEQGQLYLDAIIKQSPEILDHIKKFKLNDSIGNPSKFYYPNIGEISPTTLRYIKIASDLKILLGALDDCSIVEIGGGYGGQCKILSDLFQFKRYTIIDLPGPLALTKRFLKEQNVSNVHFLSCFDIIPDSTFDLVISNYAFSECTTNMQQKYIEYVFAHSDKGYLICNNFPANDPLSHLFSNKTEILLKLSNYHIPWRELQESPKTSLNNYLIVWSKNFTNPNFNGSLQ